VLMAAGWRAWRRGDAQLALAYCDQSLAAAQRLGDIPGSPRDVHIMSSELHGHIAQAAGATNEAADHHLEAARQARAAENPALAAHYLSISAQTLAWSDPETAQRYATEGLALARQTGTPHAIAHNLIGLAQALVVSDPQQARALLAEALQLGTMLGYESPSELNSAVFTAARLEDWPTVLRAARPLLHHQVRSGALALYTVAGILNFVARGLAEDQPEPAAVIQGSVTAMLRELSADIAASVTGTTVVPNDVAAVAANIRRDTTRLLSSTLGDTRLRELRTRGAAMDETQACTYARTQIDSYLARAHQTVS